MFYALNENVYLVAGKVKGCIYDFNGSKLYSLNESLTQKINLINAGKFRTDSADEKLKVVLEKFLELGILTTTESPETHFIDETSRRGYVVAGLQKSRRRAFKIRRR